MRVLEPATPEPAPVAPRPSHAALLWGALGVALGALAALWRSAFDDRVRDQEALEREVGVPCLGELPRVHAAPRAPPLEGPVLEAATQLSLDRSLRRRGDEGHVVLVTSAGPGEGKTTLAAHLALAFAASGEPTVLLDLDLRRPGIHVVLSDLGGALHLETLLSTLDADGPAGLPRVLPAADALDGLVVVLAPSRYDPDLLSSGRPAVLLEALRARGYRVVVDSPPTVPVPDAPRLSAAADEVLVVVRADHARLRAVRHTLRSLQAAGASLAGMVLNDAAGEHGVYASVGDYPAYRAPERGAEGG